MSIKHPSKEDVQRAASDLHLHLDEDDVTEFQEMIGAAVDVISPLDALIDNVPAVRYPRTPGVQPTPKDNPLHAWYVKTDIAGAPTGALLEYKVALKDNICLAGVPMMVGASTLEGYVPDVDATVVTRILDAGGTIAGKAHCEYFCYSGGSHTNATGPIHNPHRFGYSAGGSSSGCCAIVGADELEMAIGGDQGGSIRGPSSFCGTYGLKPTHGLVPYTGMFPVDHTLDHTGPISNSVYANALLLEVIAGADGLDPRQNNPVVEHYTDALEGGVNGLRIGLLTEGFAMAESEEDVDDAVRDLGRRLGELGAVVNPVSVPFHPLGVSIWAAIAVQGTAELVMRDDGIGAGHAGMQVLSMAQAHSAWRMRADTLSEPLKAGMLTAHYLRARYGGHYYGKAQNLVRSLHAAYQSAFDSVDLLLMPTVPFKAPPLPSTHSRSDESSPGFSTIGNTAPFNCTGHPALSLPCAMRDGLPVGAMLVGRKWAESTIYRAAAALEKSGNWRDW